MEFWDGALQSEPVAAHFTPAVSNTWPVGPMQPFTYSRAARHYQMSEKPIANFSNSANKREVFGALMRPSRPSLDESARCSLVKGFLQQLRVRVPD